MESIEGSRRRDGGAGVQRTRTSLPHRLLLAGASAWCAAILVAPLLESSTPYAFFSLVCHQNPARSWFLLGEPLGACVRCVSIYGGFLLGLFAATRPRTWLLRSSLLALGLEFGVARLGMDFEGARAISGLLVGLAAAGFVERGVGEMFRHRLIGPKRLARRRAT